MSTIVIKEENLTISRFKYMFVLSFRVSKEVSWTVPQVMIMRGSHLAPV